MRPRRHAALCASLPDRRCLGNRCARNLNQIRAWVRQGRTDAWVAHQLEVSVRDIEQFKRQNDLVSEEDATEGTTAADYPEEIDLRAEDDALIAAELEAAEARGRARQGRGRSEGRAGTGPGLR